mmetsp:Transcript_11517/g.35198  ORF Transcript_11517/g.35198 Transcript_11517/m.35198 type:complete len:122 (+) Transcript_11517:317-682(+)
MSARTARKSASLVEHYRRLGLKAGAGQREVRLAFVRLARELHPDIKGEEYKEKFQDLMESYNLLKDLNTRYEGFPLPGATRPQRPPPKTAYRPDEKFVAVAVLLSVSIGVFTFMVSLRASQ